MIVKMILNRLIDNGGFTPLANNTGMGNLNRLLRGRSNDEIAEAMLLYIYSKGRVLQGLVNRRADEVEMFLNCDYHRGVK